MKAHDEENLLHVAAYHEAARVVACYFLHKRFGYVTIESEEKRVVEIDYPEHTTKSIPSEKELAALRREHIVALAGPVAEGIAFEKCEFEDIFPLMRLPSNSVEDNWRRDFIFWRMLFVETKLLLYSPRNWKAVLALTAQLLEQKTIPHQTARDVIKQALEDYDAGIRDDISALHYSRYSEFVKNTNDAKARFRRSVEASMRSALSKHRIGK
jgi:hypothetical protein